MSLDSRKNFITIRIIEKEKNNYNVKKITQEKDWIYEVYRNKAKLEILDNFEIRYVLTDTKNEFNPLNPPPRSLSSSPNPQTSPSTPVASTSRDPFYNKSKDEQIDYLFKMIQCHQEQIIELKQKIEQLGDGPVVIDIEDERPSKRKKKIK
ncbi:hypothetical protein RclHR1_12540007 [Rhizophagus clarus]|uniref:Uncharacterized protein n=1 Tax=Rhizophagus clarus TaxID=94130 RepID=A0A2Z6QMU9_9GLOM|nr:hypothetical protein RclHR1_12540007 [Rhizophagus clarus]GES94375.1 hypothetical protein RCL_jg5784.t1 [Rhizophagus clarus]